MITERVQALFDFIDYLDSKKAEYLQKYIPLCIELNSLDVYRSKLKPKSNYIDKQKYDEIQKEIKEKFEPLNLNVHVPLLNKLKELKIWSGDDVFASIWNNNSSAIHDFKNNFESEDVANVILHKHKYLNFRKQTKSDFLGLQFVLSNLDEIYKELFDFFKDTSENEFESFENKTIEMNSIEDALKRFEDNRDMNVRFSIPHDDLFSYQNVRQYYPHLYPQSHTVKNEIIMGNKIQVGDITGHGNILNTGNQANIYSTNNVSKNNLDTLKNQLTKYGIDDDDIQELAEIVQAETPNSKTNTLGEKSNNWILKIIGKSLSGAGKIAIGISSNILAAVIRQYYGL
ncbi:hypothetical protein [Rurimicrobium arvi]|uniref:Uncharacterized protein n=1 Tax=Rurimicrobium arvi TaxID=2049916 RepID=A0ABP8MUT7_9BACT